MRERRSTRTASSGRRWTQWTESEARAVVAEWNASEDTASAFAAARGVSRARLSYWIKRLGGHDEGNAAVAFVPVEIGTSARTRREIQIDCDGVCLRIAEDVDVEHLARIVRALGRGARAC